jgi:peptidoglycan hydrolase-like protein with peptidoglycan-binding domain
MPKLHALALRKPLKLSVIMQVRAIRPSVRAYDDLKSSAPAVAAPPAREPVMLVVSLDAQRLDVYRGIKHLTTAKISSGMPGYDTRTGVFSILEKKRRHHSNLYSGAPMPWMQRLTRSGTALHAGAIPGYPASHGCVRLPYSFAPKLFELTKVGENVVVTRGRPVPTRIEHANLFQLPPLNPQVAMAADATSLPRRLSDAVTLTKASARGDQDFAAAFRSEEPLRILVTRRTAHDRVIAVQYLLADLGYLPRQNFTGSLGSATRNAIRAFQRGNALPETGAFTDELVSEVYRVAGKTEPPQGHLYVRQDFNRVFDMPIALRDPEVSLGTHVFTVVKREGDEAAPEWMAVSLDGDAVRTLDRVDIPEEVRRSIAPRLTTGSTLIIADRSEYSAILPEGDDYLVSSDEPAKTADAKVEQASAVPVRLTPVKAKQPKPRAAKATTASKPRTYTSFRREIRRRSFIRPSPYSLPYLFGR